MQKNHDHSSQIEDSIRSVISSERVPKGLYEPISYILSIGGKRVRPRLMISVYSIFQPQGVDPKLWAAIRAVEVFHNFTLLHDDLMDQSPVRRAQPTVHKKWNPNTAILSGDAMLIESYRQLQDLTPEDFVQVHREFTKMALEVCEGQQYDMEFEQRNDVSKDEYMEMIRLKTACLIASSMKIAALLGGASENDMERVYQAGAKMGLAFQLRDDFLDIYASESFGKQKGGDILAEKKTWLLLTARELQKQRGECDLEQAFQSTSKEDKIKQVVAVYDRYHMEERVVEEIHTLTTEAIRELELLTSPPSRVRPLIDFIRGLDQRKV